MVVEMPLTRGAVALVNDADAPLVGQFKWFTAHGGLRGRTRYAVRSVREGDGRQTRQTMQEFLTGRKHMDHANGDGLDNRRANLREATSALNNMNVRKRIRPASSRYKGVHWDSRDKRWRAQIRVKGRKLCLPCPSDEVEAAKAYDAAARLHYGTFATFNFPQQPGERSALV